MTSTPAPTWWEDYQAFLHDAAGRDPSFDEPLFSDDLLALLAEVDAAFVETGADTPPWEDLHLDADGERRASFDEEYSHCQNPGKHRILWARADAWIRVLTDREWADAEEIAEGSAVGWVVEPHVDRHRTTVLRPRRSGAHTLVIARTAPDDAVGSTDIGSAGAVVPGIVVGLGDPTVAVETLPDCACDACDSGSRDLLEQLDQYVLSIVDGSCEVVLNSRGHSQRTSFSASGGGDEGSEVSVQVTAGPWVQGWYPRPLCPPVDPRDTAWADETLREAWPTRLLETMIAAFPPSLAARIDSLRPGHSGIATSFAYELEPERPTTAALDALETVPPGYRRLHRSSVVTGMDFEQARSALRCWVVHRRAKLHVMASNTPLEVGTEVRLRLGIWPFLVTAPCRVVRVIDEPDRAGFAYATLPGHPESGIEEFTITRTPTGLVRFHLDAASKPATWYTRLGAPVSRLVQEVVTRRYLRALSAPS